MLNRHSLCCLLTLLVAGPTMGADGEKYALLVGVKEYPEAKELRTLPYSENDVSELAKILQGGGFRKQNVILMTQGRGEGRYMPLKKRIMEELQLLLADRQPEDTVVIAFSGHGIQLKNEKDSYFCPADSVLDNKETLISLKELYKDLEKCKAGFRLLMVDACRNDPFADKSRAPRLEVDLESVTRPDLPEPPKGVAAFFSCSEKEKAYDSDKLRHGVFFNYVVEGLRGGAAGKDGNVTVNNLSEYVKRRVKDYVRTEHGVLQKPDIMGKNYDEITLVRLGLLYGKWKGTYNYPAGDTRAGVDFDMTITPDGERFTAKTKEPNTFNTDPNVDQTKPFLFANCRGSLNEAARRVTWTKTYDGTANVSHSVEYYGNLSRNGDRIEGGWTLRSPGRPDFSGTFTLKRAVDD